LAQKSKFELIRNPREMKMHGNKIRPIHPLKFISFILSDAKLKNHLSTALNDRFKKTLFMKALTQNLGKEYKNKNLIPYLNGFLKSIGVSLDKKNEILKIIKSNKWTDLFNYLNDTSKKSSKFPTFFKV